MQVCNVGLVYSGHGLLDVTVVEAMVHDVKVNEVQVRGKREGARAARILPVSIRYRKWRVSTLGIHFSQ